MDDDKKENTADEPTGTTGSALGGAVAGAVAGTVVGLPVIGTVIGALSGAAIGAARKRPTTAKRKAKPASALPKKKKKAAAAKKPSTKTTKRKTTSAAAGAKKPTRKAAKKPTRKAGVLPLDRVRQHPKKERSECEKPRSLRGYITRPPTARLVNRRDGRGGFIDYRRSVRCILPCRSSRY